MYAARYVVFIHRIHTLTLDLDDTLWPILPVIERAERMLWRWLERQYPRISAAWDADRAADLRQSVVAEHADRAHDLRFVRRAVLARMAASCGYDEALADEAFRIFDEYRNQVDLFPDVEAGLTRLRSSYRIVALTNGNASLERIGIRHLFDDVVTAVDAGAAKPAARAFAFACERANAQPGEVLHIGDHPEFDVAGARAAGMRTAWMNRRGHDWPLQLPPPDLAVSCLIELADHLQGAKPARARQ